MSLGWGIRSDGDPYFGFVQRDLTGMQAGPIGAGGDIFYMRLDIQFHGVPERYGADDEEHALFSWFQYPDTDGDLLTIGVTPSGSIYGRGPSTNKVETQPGLLSWDNKVHALSFDYRATDGAMYIRLDDTIQVSVTGSSAQPVPAADMFGRVSLFTGASALSRVPCTILRAQFGDDEAGGLIYELEEGSGTTAATDSSFYPGPDFTLHATYWTPPLYTAWWGSPPTATIEHAFQWKYKNNWNRAARIPNDWTRV